MKDFFSIFLFFFGLCVVILLYKLYKAITYSNRLLNRKSSGLTGTFTRTGLQIIKELLAGDVSHAASTSDYQYQRKPYFMHDSERKFFTMLQSAIGNQLYIFPQVHLNTIFDEKIKGQNWKGARNHIDKKSVDFVLCDQQHLTPLLAIELDGNSHDHEDRQERDQEVERIFSESQFPLLRIPRQEYYNQQEIIAKITEALRNRSHPNP